MPQCPTENPPFGTWRRGKLDLRAASGKSRDPAEILFVRNSGIFRRECVPASDQARGRAAILDSRDPMRIKPAGAREKHDVAAPNCADWFTPDQENISREYRRQHTSATRAEPQFPEIAQDFRCKLQPQHFPGLRRRFHQWIRKTQEFFLLKRHCACVGDTFPHASAIVSKTRSYWNVGF